MGCLHWRPGRGCGLVPASHVLLGRRHRMPVAWQVPTWSSDRSGPRMHSDRWSLGGKQTPNRNCSTGRPGCSMPIVRGQSSAVELDRTECRRTNAQKNAGGSAGQVRSYLVFGQSRRRLSSSSSIRPAQHMCCERQAAMPLTTAIALKRPVSLRTTCLALLHNTAHTCHTTPFGPSPGADGLWLPQSSERPSPRSPEAMPERVQKRRESPR